MVHTIDTDATATDYTITCTGQDTQIVQDLYSTQFVPIQIHDAINNLHYPKINLEKEKKKAIKTIKYGGDEQ